MLEYIFPDQDSAAVFIAGEISRLAPNKDDKSVLVVTFTITLFQGGILFLEADHNRIDI